MTSVRILASDLVEVTVRPSWWRRLLGNRPETFRAFRTFEPPHDWRREDPPFRLVYVDHGRACARAIERADDDADRRRAARGLERP